MKQKVLETEFGRTLVIEGFDPVTTTIGLTPSGMLDIECILIKNCLRSGEDAVILSSPKGLFLMPFNESFELKSELESLIRNWINLSYSLSLPTYSKA